MIRCAQRLKIKVILQQDENVKKKSEMIQETIQFSPKAKHWTVLWKGNISSSFQKG